MRNKLDFVETDCDDLACHQGTTFEIHLRIVDYCTGVPDDLTNYSATLTIYNSDNTVYDTVSGSITEPTKGLISFVISPSETANYIIGLYSHTINLSNGINNYRIGEGSFEVVL